MNKWDRHLLLMNLAHDAAAGTILPDTMMEGRTALDVTTTNAQPMPPSDVWKTRPRTIKELVDQYQMMSGTTSGKQQLNGSDVMEWTYRQLSETDWSGPHETNNSSFKWETYGKLETSGDSGLTSSASATRVGMLMSAYTFMEKHKIHLEKAWEEDMLNYQMAQLKHKITVAQIEQDWL
jgi:hypothetical protein